MLNTISRLLILLALGFMVSDLALGEANDELDFDTEAGLQIDLNQEISKQEVQIRAILKALDEKTQPQRVNQDPSKTLTVTLVSKKSIR